MSTQPATAAPVGPWYFTPDQLVAPWMTLFQKAMAAPKVYDAMRNTRVGATPTRCVYREDNLRLLKYESDVEPRFKTPLILIFALINRPYILDLRPGKSVIAHFVQRGFDCYNIDWGVPADGDRELGLKDYVLRYIDHVVDDVRERCGVEQVNLLGYCMGGSMTAMYAALRPEKVRNVMLMAAPVDWSQDDALLKVWSHEDYFDVDRFVSVHGNIPPQWLQVNFQMLKPVQNYFEKWIGFYEKMEDEKFLEDFFAMEMWLNDNIPVAGEVFRQFVKCCFQKNQLIKGKLLIGDERVDLKRIACPILNLVAQQDHLVPPSQSLPFNEAVSSTDRKIVNYPVGHIGLAVSSKAHRDLWPKVTDWLEQRSETLPGYER